MIKKIKQAGEFKKINYLPPPDKSISHRALILAAAAPGKSVIKNISLCEDVKATAACLKKLGVKIKFSGRAVSIAGKKDFKISKKLILETGASATSMRLLTGFLAGLGIPQCELRGEPSLNRRPMDRLALPLSKMGAEISLKKGLYPPVKIAAAKLGGIAYKLPVPSAQIKSALLLAGLNAEGETSVKEKIISRDHTERLLFFFGAKIKKQGLFSKIRSCRLNPSNFSVPGDFSSASPFLTIFALAARGELTIKKVGLNPTRLGLLENLLKMGADIKIKKSPARGPEPKGEIKVVSGARLKGIYVPASETAKMIDEIPLFCLAAALAEGETVLESPGELVFKESDRLAGTIEILKKSGADIKFLKGNLRIKGVKELKGGFHHDGGGDHRMIMLLAAAGLFSKKPVLIKTAQKTAKSYPGFWKDFSEITKS